MAAEATAVGKFILYHQNLRRGRFDGVVRQVVLNAHPGADEASNLRYFRQVFSECLGLGVLEGAGVQYGGVAFIDLGDAVKQAFLQTLAVPDLLADVCQVVNARQDFRLNSQHFIEAFQNFYELEDYDLLFDENYLITPQAMALLFQEIGLIFPLGYQFNP